MNVPITDWKRQCPYENCHPRVQRFRHEILRPEERFSQPVNQILLTYAVKTVTDNVEFIQMLKRLFPA